MEKEILTPAGAALHGTLVEEMFSAGVHFGYSKSRRHPSMKPYVFGAKNTTEIIDLEKTSEMWGRAANVIKELGKTGKQILFVGGKHEAYEALVKAAQAIGMPYAAHRWVGGTLTNFPQIRKRIAELENLTGKREKAEFHMYTKKERLMIDREIADLEKKFAGLLPLRDMPAVLFVIDNKREHIAAEEARKMSIPVISLSNTDCDISGIAYPIAGNDSSRSAIEFFTKRAAEAYAEGRASVTPAH